MTDASSLDWSGVWATVLGIWGSVFLSVLFACAVWLLRDAIKSFLFPHITLSRGSAGSPHAVRSMFSKWIVSLSRLEFYFTRDWLWLLILSLNTILFCILPLTGESVVQSERASMILLSFFLIELIAITIAWWKSAYVVGVSSFVRYSYRTLLLATVMTFLIGYLGIAVGTQDFTTVLKSPLLVKNPPSVIALLCVLLFIQALKVEAPMRAEGWGIQHIAKSFLEIFWFTLLVIVFLGALADTPELIFFELILKTLLLIVVCDAISMFVPSLRGTLVERTTLYLVVPLGITIIVSFWLRSLL